MNAIDFDTLERDIHAHHEEVLHALAVVRSYLKGMGERAIPAALAEVLAIGPIGPISPIKALPSPPKGRKAGRPPKPTPKPAVIRAARGGVQDQVRHAIEQQSGEFNSRHIHSLCPTLKRSSISTQLTRWADAGILTKVDRAKTGANGPPSFTYKRGPKWGGTKTVSESVSDSSPSPLGGERAGVRGDSVPTQVPKSGTYPMKVKPNDRLNAIRAIARYFGAKTWLANEMIDELQKRFPHLVNSSEKITGARFQIMELRESGELKSVGTSAARYFTMTAQLADDDAPKPMGTIHVPRDPDTDNPE
jgi:hypothetical protein